MKGVVITIAGNDLACARAWSAESLRNVKGPNPMGFSEPDRFLKSNLGYLAWLRWCRLYGLRCRYKVITDGKSHHDNFMLFEAGAPRECMVKTASWSHYKKFMLPVAQRVREAALYVGMRALCDVGTDVNEVDEIGVECWGVMDGTDVAHLPVEHQKVPSRHHPLMDLGPVIPVRNTYDQGGLELQGRAVELEHAPTFQLT